MTDEEEQIKTRHAEPWAESQSPSINFTRDAVFSFHLNSLTSSIWISGFIEPSTESKVRAIKSLHLVKI